MEKLKHHHRIVSYIKHELVSHELHPGRAYNAYNIRYGLSRSVIT